MFESAGRCHRVQP